MTTYTRRVSGLPPQLARLGASLERGLASLAVSRVFRALFALAILAGHLVAITRLAHDTYGLPFNSAPEARLHDPASGPEHWDRLVVSRWDSLHYIAPVTPGETSCPEGHIDVSKEPDAIGQCQLNFYPGYPLLGWLASFGGGLPPDYSLLAVSLVASFVFLYAWTSATMVDALGVGATYASLAAFNLFPSAYVLVTILTEPCVVALTLTAFLCLSRKRYLLGAALAGAATGLRVSGSAVGAAYGVALIVATVRAPPQGPAAWARRALAIGASGWGMFALFAYDHIRYGDALMYVHAHSVSYNHAPAFLAVFMPEPEWIKRALYDPFHTALWVFAALMWFALGHRRALSRFSIEGQVYWYALFALSWYVSVSGTITLGLPGQSRYMLAALPWFFALGSTLRRHPGALALWLLATGWFYWHADMCHFVGGVGDDRFQKCHDEIVSGGGY